MKLNRTGTTNRGRERTTMGKPKLDAATCEHDYVNFVRKGRARYHCPKCDADITLECVMLAESLMEETEDDQ